MKTGIVLGAGGSFGWAWHLGVLRAMQDVLGLDIAEASDVVGTSAGAAMAVARLSGASNEQVMDIITSPPDEATRLEMEQLRGELRSVRRWLRPMAPKLMINPGPLAGPRAFVGLLPVGPFPTYPLQRFPAPQTWPDNLAITAVGLHDGRRVAWRAGDGVAVYDAMEASGCVPGLFVPKVVGGAGYVDGAVASATNADLLLDRGLERIIVSSPMTRPGRGPVRIWSRRRLRIEVDQLRASGATVHVVGPTAADIDRVEGDPVEDRDVRRPLADQAYACASKVFGA